MEEFVIGNLSLVQWILLFGDRLMFVVLSLWFEQPKPGNDGSFPVDNVKAISGEKLLRNIMLDNKIELYAPYVSFDFCTIWSVL